MAGSVPRLSRDDLTLKPTALPWVPTAAPSISMMSDTVHILGVRHHGPGSARSVVRALDQLKPDCVLIEGPPDADGLIAYAGRADLVPPVAILVYDVERPAAAVYYPLADFSPEWQAMRWAVSHSVPVRFMDLPQWHGMAIEAEQVERAAAEGPPPPRPPARDPLQQLAEAAGFDDGERWWEHVVEGRRHDGVEIFAAVAEAMAAVRADAPEPVRDEQLREAWMRRTIRESVKAGSDKVAVICGAWHAPALTVEAVPKKADDELLSGVPKRKTAATWIPWTYDRLATASGYGAGIHSPGWYDHLWHRSDLVVESWMARVAGLLRAADIDCSSAHVIEAVRLSTTLATLRGRPLADLADVADATRSVFAGDGEGPMRLIARDLLVGDRIGAVPEDAPAVPLQQDLQREQKRLRLKPEAGVKPLRLDLREELGRGRSVLLHRLRLLGIAWGTPTADGSRGKGTFHEDWQLSWEPGYAVRLIEAGPLGNTIAAAAGAAVARAAAEVGELRSLVERLHDATLADLADAAAALVRRIEDVAAVSSDVGLLMHALPPLAEMARYGTVRQTDAGLVRGIIDGIVPRVSAGLGGAAASLNDDAAAIMDDRLRSTDAALRQLEAADLLTDWQAALARVVDADAVHGLVRGRAARLLLDAGRLSADDVARRLGQTLSAGTDPGQGARWMQGFLTGSGLLLIHDPKLLSLVNVWVSEIAADAFEEVLPLLRRTFAAFPAPERKQIGQLAAGGRKGTGPVASARVDVGRAKRALPLLVAILGGNQ